MFQKLHSVFVKNSIIDINKNFLYYNNNFRNLSTYPDIIAKQNEFFNLEKKRQKESVGRVEKIKVHYIGKPENAELIMNKNISTPYDCARHISELVTKRSAVALLNGETLWHMHRPLPDSCTLDLLHFNIAQPAQVNKVFWRSCSFLLGATAASAFKDNVTVHLHSFPSPNVRSGSFIYDVELGLNEWTPTQDELRVLSIEMIKLIQRNLPFEYLNVSTELALEIFKHNPHKSAQIPDIAIHNDQTISLYRVGTHIDISKGPMVGNTALIGRCSVAAVHKLPTERMWRFQGVALPRDIHLNHFAFGVVEERARKLNAARIPGQEQSTEEQQIASQATV